MTSSGVRRLSPLKSLVISWEALSRRHLGGIAPAAAERWRTGTGAAQRWRFGGRAPARAKLEDLLPLGDARGGATLGYLRLALPAAGETNAVGQTAGACSEK